MTSRDQLAAAQADLAWLERHDAIAGIAEVIRERRHQIEVRGYTTLHDDGHPLGWLAADAVIRLAGAAYMARYDPAKVAAIPELAAPAALVAAEIDRISGSTEPAATEGPPDTSRQQRW